MLSVSMMLVFNNDNGVLAQSIKLFCHVSVMSRLGKRGKGHTGVRKASATKRARALSCVGISAHSYMQDFLCTYK